MRDLRAQGPLDLLNHLGFFHAWANAYLNQAFAIVGEKGGAALHAVNGIQSRQHGRDSLSSAAPAVCQGIGRNAEHESSPLGFETRSADDSQAGLRKTRGQQRGEQADSAGRKKCASHR